MEHQIHIIKEADGYKLQYFADAGVRTIMLNDEYDVGEKVTSLIQEYEDNSEL